jgi:hypothetical protein
MLNESSARDDPGDTRWLAYPAPAHSRYKRNVFAQGSGPVDSLNGWDLHIRQADLLAVSVHLAHTESDDSKELPCFHRVISTDRPRQTSQVAHVNSGCDQER